MCLEVPYRGRYRLLRRPGMELLRLLLASRASVPVHVVAPEVVVVHAHGLHSPATNASRTTEYRSIGRPDWLNRTMMP